MRLALVLAAALLVFAAVKSFGEKPASVAVLQPAESKTLRQISSRLPTMREPIFSVMQVARGKGAAAIYAGTRKGLLRSEDQGSTWERVFSPGIFSGSVEAVAAAGSPKDPFLYIGAGKSFFRLDKESGKAQRLLKTVYPLRCAALHPKDSNQIVIGTEREAYVSRDGGMTWQVVGGLPEGIVYGVAFHPFLESGCYALTSAGLFISRDGLQSWQRIWVKRQEEAEGNSSDEPASDLAEQEEMVGPRSLAIDRQSGRLYLADQGKVLMSSDEGQNWEPVPMDLPGDEINALWLDLGGKHLWIGTERGLFQLPLPAGGIAAPLPGPAPVDGGHPRNEPSIQEVQRAAIRYAEVMPQKISRWRALAQLRNFIPKFTVSLNRDRDTTIASATSSGKTHFTVGPEDKSVSVDFGFTWNLADLVWDSAQTSIDVRSRLMVQLRQDVLEEVTRLYFERKRLLAEFEANPTEDPVLLQERSLRIEELTARLDSFTGGWYSDNFLKGRNYH